MYLDKRLYTLLLLSLALTLLTVLQPSGTEATTDADDLLSERHVLTATTEPVIRSWQRPVQPLTATTRAPVVTSPVPTTPPQPPAWSEPPALPPVMAEMPPPRPAAPEPEFRYLGRLNRDDKTWVFIAQGDNSYAVALGDTFEGRWRFDAVQADRLDLTYLPLRTTRSLTLRKE